MCQLAVKLAMLAAAVAALLFTAQVDGQQWAEQQFVQTLGPDVASGFASCISNDWDQLDTCWQQTDCVSDYYGFDDIVNCYQQYNCDTSNLGYCVQNYPIVVNNIQPQFQPQQQQFQPQPQQQQQPQTYYPGNNNFQPMYPQNYPQNYPQQQQQSPAPYDQPTQDYHNTTNYPNQ